MIKAIFKLSRIEFWLLIALFILLWTYLIARAFLVFYLNDELGTKWLFMIRWDFIPYKGFIGANNHFVNSFLGGLFIRLLNSDSMWIIRLPNLLAFLFFYWGLVGLKPYFRFRVNFYAMFVPVILSVFIIEFFALARGYGLSMAFFVMAILFTFRYNWQKRSFFIVAAILSWILCVYSNLIMIPFAATGVVYLAIQQWKKHKIHLVCNAVGLWFVWYAIKYSFFLKGRGRLYLGDKLGFFDTTIHSLTKQLWNAENLMIDITLVISTIFILFVLIRQYLIGKDILHFGTFFGIFFLIGIGNLVLQNLLLGVNYPHTRGAIYLVPLFFGALAFSFDSLKIKWVGTPIIVLALIMFIVDCNFEFVKAYPFDHFDEKLVTLIPEELNGTPPTTGGRYWGTDDALSRQNNFPYRCFQNSDKQSDTLVDYMLMMKKVRPDIENWYKPIYSDKISEITLYERKEFLPRTLFYTDSVLFACDGLYIDLYNDSIIQPSIIRCKGEISGIDLFHEVSIVITSENSREKKAIGYESCRVSYGCSINDNNTIHFDFTYVQPLLPNADLLKVYVYNPDKDELQGKIYLELYLVE